MSSSFFLILSDFMYCVAICEPWVNPKKEDCVSLYRNWLKLVIMHGPMSTFMCGRKFCNAPYGKTFVHNATGIDYILLYAKI